ncbi:brevican core protein-like isoform X1 [Limulus polyphemus]|uniref:Brevican core protein-like isoform X1 n=1 Tax=Limulus polyphemus TaxID=6850 RepID=A0ABM1SRF5_LIMPO|nr:brevican core protein-like isoform X1 [Limulus polyphemus]XP_022246211.1 brevican core protein-like isoform X1 [Limulus polyphemus]
MTRFFGVWSQLRTCKDRPCRHGGHCIEKTPDLRDSNGFRCDCGFGFSGPTCEMPIPPYVPFGNSFFKLSDSKMMWNQSKAACEEEGAHLAVVPDSATNDFLKHLINTTYEGFPSSHWIGVKRLKECNYTTIHGFTDWAPGQPVCNYDCVHLWSASNLMWDDTDCKHLFNYICEITFF